MESLVLRLKDHFEWKSETQKYNSINSVEKTVKSTFKKLEKEFETFSLQGKKIVHFITNDDNSKLELHIDTMLSANHQKRKIICELQNFSGNPKYLLSCILPDTKFKNEILKIGIIEIYEDKSVVKFSEQISDIGLYGEDVFTRSTFEELVESVVLFNL